MTSAKRPIGATPATIIRMAGVCGGEPTVAGTRVPVRSIIVQWQYHRDLARVRSAFPRLSIPAIRAALAYYETHQDEIDRLIEENERVAYAAD